MIRTFLCHIEKWFEKFCDLLSSGNGFVRQIICKDLTFHELPTIRSVFFQNHISSFLSKYLRLLGTNLQNIFFFEKKKITKKLEETFFTLKIYSDLDFFLRKTITIVFLKNHLFFCSIQKIQNTNR